MEKKYKILLCEDDENLGSVLKTLLEQNNFEVLLEKDGKAGLETFRRVGNIDLCLLDVMMPKMDGFKLAEKINAINSEVNFFFITAKSEKEDIIRGYKLGAEDYIIKPFDGEVLIIKIKNTLQRYDNDYNETINVSKVTEYKIGKFIFNSKFRKLQIGKSEITLSPKETILLQLLCERKNDLLERTIALQKIWGSQAYFNSRSMDVFITKLRKYFIEDPNVRIENIHGSGFRLVFPEK